MTRRCLNIAHRGASAMAPENTLPAFQKAIEDGADMIELDVHLTRDNHLVVIHDKNVSRTTDGTGNVTEMTLEEIKRLDAGARFSITHAGLKILTLDDVIQLTRGKIGLNVEVKASHPSDDLVVECLLAVLAKAGIEGEAIISSFSHSILKKLREQSAVVRTGFLYNISISPLSTAKSLDANAIHPNVAVVSAELVRKAHQAGIAVNAWTVDDPKEMGRLVDLGVDGIVTNNPLALAEVLASRS